MRRLLVATVLLGLIPSTGFTQDLAPPQMKLEWAQGSEAFSSEVSVPAYDPWTNLRDLKPEQKIRVVDTSFKKLKGRFLRVSEDALSLRVSGKEITVSRPDVVMVSLRHSRAGEIGGLILVGLLQGAIAWGEADRYERHGYDRERLWREKGKGTRKGLSARSLAVFAGAGAASYGLMAAFSDHDDQVIYIHDRNKSYALAPADPALKPVEGGKLEGGNVFAPVRVNYSAKAREGEGKQDHH